MDSALKLISQSSLKQQLPTFKIGQTVRIHQRIREGEKERVQVFEGIIIHKSNGTGINGTITVRKVVDGIGVERLFAIHSPSIAKIEITKQAKVRRSKLYFLRNLTGKSARLKTTLLDGQVFEPKSTAALEAEAAKAAEEKAQAEAEAAAAKEAEKAAEAEAEAPATEEAAENAPEEKAEATEAPAEEAAPQEEAKEEAPAEEAPAEEASEEEKKDA